MLIMAGVQVFDTHRVLVVVRWIFNAHVERSPNPKEALERACKAHSGIFGACR